MAISISMTINFGWDVRKNINSVTRCKPIRTGARTVLVLAALLFFGGSLALRAQTAGEGTLSGTVTDGSGAAVGGATVTATNNATGIAATRTSTSAGLYTISPLL